MKIVFMVFSSFFLTLLLISCMETGPQRGKGIDQEPMYGGMDRQSVPLLRLADEDFIAKVTKEFGSRERASQLFVEQGVRFYRMDNYAMAMKRFNQAWLLNPKNPYAFWGFAIVYHDEGKNCRSKEMIDRALELNLSHPIPLADAGRIYTLCAVDNPPLDKVTKKEYLAMSEKLFHQAISKAPNNDSILETWATALYWEGDYSGAWVKVNQARKAGGRPSEKFLNLLRSKMPEPKELL